MSEATEKCACVVLNYNDSDTTISFINNVLDYSLIDKIIVVDNCSTDDSYNKLSALQNDKVALISAEINGGYGAGNNIGIKLANQLGYKYVLLSNPDVIFKESVVRSLIESVVEDDKIAVATAKQLDKNGKCIRLFAWKIPTIKEACLYPTKIAFVKGYATYKTNEINSDKCYVDCIPGAFFLLDSNKFIEIGGYDEKMFLYCEETVLGIKIKRYGYRTLLLANETYLHLHGVSVNKSIKKERIIESMINKNRLYVMKEYLKANTIQIIIARIIYSAVGIKNVIKRMLIHR